MYNRSSSVACKWDCCMHFKASIIIRERAILGASLPVLLVSGTVICITSSWSLLVGKSHLPRVCYFDLYAGCYAHDESYTVTHGCLHLLVNGYRMHGNYPIYIILLREQSQHNLSNVVAHKRISALVYQLINMLHSLYMSIGESLYSLHINCHCSRRISVFSTSKLTSIAGVSLYSLSILHVFLMNMPFIAIIPTHL